MILDKRAQDHFHLDRTINISSVIAFLILLGTIVSYGNGILNSIHEANDKINIMWDDFTTSKPQYKTLYPNRNK